MTLEIQITGNNNNGNKINFDNLPSLDFQLKDVPAEFLKGYNDVNNFLTAFSNYLNISKRVQSENTKRTYLSNTKQFLVWCNKLQFGINNVNSTLVCRNLVICYEKALTDTDLAQNSKALKQQSIKKFFEYWAFTNEKNFQIDLRKCFSADWITSFDQSAFKRQVRINEDIFDAVKKVAYAGDLNDKIVFYLLSWGLRRSEIVGLKISDIDFVNNEMNVYMVKTKEVKKIPAPDWLTSDSVNRQYVYLVFNKSKRTAKTKGIKPCTTNYIYGLITKWINKTKYKNVEITPHSFRRYLCSSLLAKGYAESQISKITGHSDIKMVGKYGYDTELKNNPIIKDGAIKG